MTDVSTCSFLFWIVIRKLQWTLRPSNKQERVKRLDFTYERTYLMVETMVDNLLFGANEFVYCQVLAAPSIACKNLT